LTEQAFLVGVDLVEIERIERACRRWGERFKAKVFTPEELRLCNGQISCLAARFAAKEAVAKALGTGVGPISWREVEILGDDSGKPYLRLHGKALAKAQELGIKGWSISLAHSRAMAIAFAVGWVG